MPRIDESRESSAESGVEKSANLRKALRKKDARTAYVYSNYLDTSGGGERSTLDFCMALDNLGFEVTLVTARRCKVSLKQLQENFGIPEKYSWKLKQFDSELHLGEEIKQKNVYLFVNHTFESYLANYAKVGLYLVMFPLPTLPPHIANLLTYDQICCISKFSQTYTKQHWYEDLPTDILYPPISNTHLKADKFPLHKKERLILQIGRFNVAGHSKKQLEAIKCFRQLKETKVLGSAWKMVVVGRVNSGAKNEEYVELCHEAARGAGVEIITNVSLETLQNLYQKAACLWQFTGFGLDFGDIPQHCEHLGLVAMDCFAYGVIPMIYQRSGMVPLVEYGRNGFSFGSYEELGDIMRAFAAGFGGPLHQRLTLGTQSSVAQLSFKEYQRNIEIILERFERKSHDSSKTNFEPCSEEVQQRRAHAAS